jgi:hypothetical protein
MPDEDSEHLLEVPAVDDQEPVETFRAHGADEAFGDRVRLRRERLGIKANEPPGNRVERAADDTAARRDASPVEQPARASSARAQRGA